MIISVLLRFLEKIDRRDLKPAVWKGAFIGMFIAIAVGIAFVIAFYETGKAAFTGSQEYVVEAVLVSMKGTAVVLENTCVSVRITECHFVLSSRAVPSLSFSSVGNSADGW